MPEDWYEGQCKSCGAEARASGNSTKDYHYFCTNPDCGHASGCDLYDLGDIPDWIKSEERHGMTPEEIKKKFELIDAQFRGMADVVYILLEAVQPLIGHPMGFLKKSMADIDRLRAELKAGSEPKEVV